MEVTEPRDIGNTTHRPVRYKREKRTGQIELAKRKVNALPSIRIREVTKKGEHPSLQREVEGNLKVLEK